MILDINVVAQAMKWVSSTTTSRGAVAQSSGMTDTFTGDELAVRLFGKGYLVGAVPLDLSSALTMRGAVVVNSVGRVGVAVGAGKVVEACGRSYALTTTNPTWWAAGWLPTSVVKTIGLPVTLPTAGSQVPKPSGDTSAATTVRVSLVADGVQSAPGSSRVMPLTQQNRKLHGRHRR